jgi:DnaK suppressor protein
MEKNDLDYFKNLLTMWLDELINHADHTVESLLEIRENSSDFLDRASFESASSTALRIRDRESLLIKKICLSLEDIENGEYGICQDCGENISIARLKARPVTQYCIHCKTKRETYERSTGL